MNTRHIAPITTSSIEFMPAAKGLLLPEGPVAMADGSVLLTEVARGTVSCVSTSGAVTVVAELGGGPNGLAIGPDGALYVCNNGGGIRAQPGEEMLHIEFAPELYRGGSIERVDLDSGAVTTLYTACEGRPLLAPNDLVFDRHGGLWFTDYGRATPSGRDFGGIYYCQPDGSRIVRCLDQQLSPNGIGLNAEEDRLYWADSMTARVWVCEIASPGVLARPPSPFMVGDRGIRPAGVPAARQPCRRSQWQRVRRNCHQRRHHRDREHRSDDASSDRRSVGHQYLLRRT